MGALETTTVIQPDEEHNALPENRDSQNIYITGDNIDALKHLLKSYAHSIQCIYIDPPYNTGSDGFVYKDNFNLTHEELQERLHITYDDAEKLLHFTQRESASHSAWLTFMAPRLSLTRDFLSEDGVIFISIDDNEQANLKLLCDRVFGEENFIANNIWKSKSGGANDSASIATDHEYVLTYAKNVAYVSQMFDNDLTVTTVYNKEDEHGRFALDRLDKQSLGYNESLDFPIKGPDGKVYTVQHKDPNHKQARWRWSRDTVNKRYEELVFIYPYVYTKNYEKKEGLTPRSILVDERFGRTRTGSTD